MSPGYEVPASRNLVVVEVPPDFSEVVVRLAEKEGRVYADELLHLAIAGAEHKRLCKESK